MLKTSFIRWTLLFLGILLYTFRFSISVHFPEVFSEEVIFIATALGAVFLIAYCLVSPKVQALLNLPLLVRFGRISYSIYLAQSVVLLGIIPWLIKFAYLTIGPRPAWWMGFLGITAIVILFSELSYRWVELPNISIGKRVSKRIKKSEN